MIFHVAKHFLCDRIRNDSIQFLLFLLQRPSTILMKHIETKTLFDTIIKTMIQIIIKTGINQLPICFQRFKMIIYRKIYIKPIRNESNTRVTLIIYIIFSEIYTLFEDKNKGSD